ncbi:hypothetical protein F4775DRAFT_562369 [Biscogniauxia sp. FL1348]|nr:hypothetical protein F4775DRAFT_562369 [Biscogniauxia sp. FL1348]
MAGFLIPPWYEPEIPDNLSMNICSIIWGFSLCCSVFTCTKAAQQTWLCHRRGKLPFNAYIIMVWAEWTSSLVISIVSWMLLKGYIPPGFWIYFAILCLWTVQVHCILQIIINRVGLLVMRKSRVRMLKMVVFLIIAAINVLVFCIWLPARLQLSRTYVHANEIWDRIEKAIFATVDMSLNVYFIYTVRTKLVAGGLTKYYSVFRFNLAMIFLSVSMDVILIGTMSMRSGLVYIQFHPLVYLVKLHIELNMASLIAKIVKASNPLNDSSALHVTSAAPSEPHTSLMKTITSNRGCGEGVSEELYSEGADLGVQPVGITKMTEMGVAHHRATDGPTVLDESGSSAGRFWRKAEDMV